MDNVLIVTKLLVKIVQAVALLNAQLVTAKIKALLSLAITEYAIHVIM